MNTPLGARERYPIPVIMNIAIIAVQLVCVSGCFIALRFADHWTTLIPLAAVFGVVMNSVYSTIHEAHHRMLFPDRRVNDGCGILLSLLFPAPFHLLRQGHIGHHRENRSDNEVFDLYFEHDNRIWKYLAWYGILTGFYWVLVVLSNVVLIVWPGAMKPERYGWDRTSKVFLEHFDPKSFRVMRLEAIGAVLLHLSLIWFLDVSWVRYGVMYFGFGWMWSSLQYVHHYGAERDVRDGAKNLHAFRLLDRLWMNHNWHQTHHQHPTTPWTYLPDIAAAKRTPSESLLRAYRAMWRGPQPAETAGKNEFIGEISRSA